MPDDTEAKKERAQRLHEQIEEIVQDKSGSGSHSPGGAKPATPREFTDKGASRERRKQEEKR